MPEEYITKTEAFLAFGAATIPAGNFLLKSGDTMIGDLILNADPSAVLGAVTKQYADAGDVFDDTKHGTRSGGTLHADVSAGGNDGFMTGTDKTKLDTIAAGANAYSHPNHSGEVTSSGDGVQTIANDAVTNVKAANMAQSTIKGRASGAGTGNPIDLSATQARTILNVENGATADQSDVEIKTAYENNADTNEFSDAEQTKLAGIATGATVDQTKTDIDALGIDADKLDGLEAIGFVKEDGSVAMSGLLTLFGAPSINLHACTKQYADEVTAGVAHLPKGYIIGFRFQPTAADPDHDIVVKMGEARDTTDTDNIVNDLASFVKRIDAAWVVGTGNGGLDTGTVAADKWYYVWAIKRSDTGIVDFMFSLSHNIPTMPTNYDLKRRIGAVLTNNSSNIIYFKSYAQGSSIEFRWLEPIQDVVGTFTTGGSNIIISVPAAVSMLAIFDIRAWYSGVRYGLITGGADFVPSASLYTIVTSNGATADAMELTRHTTSGRIRERANGGSMSFVIFTLGWVDSRDDSE